MALVRLAGGKELKVNETLAQIEQAVNSRGPVITPMIRLTESGIDRPVLVFAGNIISVIDR